jgi:hypothetical protein
MNLFITLLENVNKSRTSANNVSFEKTNTHTSKQTHTHTHTINQSMKKKTKPEEKNFKKYGRGCHRKMLMWLHSRIHA